MHARLREGQGRQGCPDRPRRPAATVPCPRPRHRARCARLEASSQPRPGTAAQVLVLQHGPGPEQLAAASGAGGGAYSLASLGAAGQPAAAYYNTPGRSRGYYADGPDEDASTSAVSMGLRTADSAAAAAAAAASVSAKEHRIQELRAALSSVMSERAALQREVAAVKVGCWC